MKVDDGGGGGWKREVGFSASRCVDVNWPSDLANIEIDFCAYPIRSNC